MVTSSRLVTLNVQGLPRCWIDDHLKGIRGRHARIASRIAARGYGFALLQEDFFRLHAGAHSPLFPASGLTTKAPDVHDVKFVPYRSQTADAGGWLARKGWLAVISGRSDSLLTVVNTHLDAGESDADVESRWGQLVQLHEWLDEHVPTSWPLIVAGDFNPESSPERSSLQGWAAALELTNWTPPDTRKQKDYVFARGVRGRGCYEDEVLSELSDHPALVFEFDCKPSPPPSKDTTDGRVS